MNIFHIKSITEDTLSVGPDDTLQTVSFESPHSGLKIIPVALFSLIRSVNKAIGIFRVSNYFAFFAFHPRSFQEG